MGIDFSDERQLYISLLALLEKRARLKVFSYGDPKAPESIAIENVSSGEVVLSANRPPCRYFTVGEEDLQEYVWWVDHVNHAHASKKGAGTWENPAPSYFSVGMLETSKTFVEITKKEADQIVGV